MENPLTTGDFVNSIFGNRAKLYLVDDSVVCGRLVGVDSSFNVVLTEVTKRNCKGMKGKCEKCDDIFIRGNNIKLIEEEVDFASFI